MSYYITYIKGHEWSTKHRVLRSHRSKMRNIRSNIRLSCLCQIWVLCVVDHLWPLIFRSLPTLLSTLFSLVPAMCNRTSCTQVHELPQTHCGGKQEGTLLLWLHIYIHIYKTLCTWVKNLWHQRERSTKRRLERT